MILLELKKKNSKVLAACVRKKKLSFVEKILRNSKKKKPKQLKLVDLFLSTKCN